MTRLADEQKQQGFPCRFVVFGLFSCTEQRQDAVEDLDQPAKRAGVGFTAILAVALGLNILKMRAATITVALAVWRCVAKRSRFTTLCDNCTTAIADIISSVALGCALRIHLVFQCGAIGRVVRLINGDFSRRNCVVANRALLMLAASFLAGRCLVNDPFAGRMVFLADRLGLCALACFASVGHFAFFGAGKAKQT